MPPESNSSGDSLSEDIRGRALADADHSDHSGYSADTSSSDHSEDCDANDILGFPDRRNINWAPELAEICEGLQRERQDNNNMTWAIIARLLRQAGDEEMEGQQLLREFIALESRAPHINARNANELRDFQAEQQWNQQARRRSLQRMDALIPQLAELVLNNHLYCEENAEIIDSLERYFRLLTTLRSWERNELRRQGVFAQPRAAQYLGPVNSLSSNDSDSDNRQGNTSSLGYWERRCLICHRNVPRGTTPRPFEENTGAVLTFCCQQIFHRDCLEQWWLYQLPFCCPHCRGEAVQQWELSESQQD